MTPPHDRETETENVLLITVREGDAELCEEGRDAIERLDQGDPIDQPDSVTFPDEGMLTQTFNDRTLGLLRAITNAEPESIRETARLVERDVKNVHEELTRLEAMGVIRFVEDGRSKRPVFPYDELVITVPFNHRSDPAPA
jgi:predicted transcriptional regulator